MRTDIKIGVAVLLVLLVLAVLWMLFSAPQKDDVANGTLLDTPTPGELETESSSPDDLDVTDIGPVADVDEPTPADDSLDDILSGIDQPGPTDIGVPAPGVPTPPIDTAPPAVDTFPAPPVAVDVPTEAGVPVTLGIDEAPVRLETVPVIPPTTDVTPLVSAQRKHTIKEGETLWIIAEIEYGPGNGRHWEKIKQANPGINASNLRVGQLITIPALVREPAASTYGPGLSGTLARTASGQKTYTVREGDSLWKIAARPDVYGNGSKWELIAAANRNVNAMALRPGMKLIIPPLQTPAAVTISSAGSTSSTPLTGGQSIYIVQEGDSGMWGVAVKKLGSGKYWPAIAQTNKGVNPSRLKPGMKLTIPSLQQAKQIIGERSSSSATTPRSVTRRTPTIPRPAPASDGEPVFD